VLSLLKQGSPQPVAGGSTSNTTGANTVLNGFLDSDGDGDVDIGDAMSMAGRFLNQR
jgi:hypothetical protein